MTDSYLYILKCRDGKYYVGTTRRSLEQRVAEHNAGTYDGWTANRRPVELVYWERFENIDDAVAAERQIKGWRREKKEALIRGELQCLPVLSMKKNRRPIGQISQSQRRK